MNLYIGSNKLERLSDTDDWFSRAAVNADIKNGERIVTETVDMLVKLIKEKR